MQHYSKWSWEEKQKLIIKIVEWAQKNNKNCSSVPEALLSRLSIGR